MQLFLTENLLGFDLHKSDSQTGESRGGKYVARVQIGTEKDGSPLYRYFRSQDEYDSYLEGAGKKKEREAKQKKQSKELGSKLKQEQEASKQAQEGATPRKLGEKAREKRKEKEDKKKEEEKDDKKVEKSFRLYLRSNL